MPQVLVKVQDQSQNLNEWAIIELQGDLQTKSGESLGGKFIGHLFYTTKGVPVLIVGHHVLYGKVLEIETPLTILRRDRTFQSEDHIDPLSSSSSRYNFTTDYKIIAVVKKKLLFKTRPKPIVPPQK